MVDDGAAIVDVGGESTRPGSAGVSLDVELARVLPVIEGSTACRSRSTPRRPRSPAGRWRRSDDGQRRDGAARRRRRWRASWRRAARTSASCTCRASRARCRTTRATTTSWRRWRRASTSGSRSPSRRASRADASASTRGSASARRSRTPSRSSAAGGSSSAGRPVLVGVSRKRFLGRARRSGGDARLARRVAAAARGARRRRLGAARARRARARRRAAGGAACGSRVREVEIRGRAGLFGRHGVLPAERELGQRFRFDLVLVVGERRRCDTASWTRCTTARSPSARWPIADGRPTHLLEALADAIADDAARRVPARARDGARAQARRPCRPCSTTFGRRHAPTRA